MIRDINWFKNEIIPQLTGYDFSFKSFGEGDFGTLERIEFENSTKCGYVDFWSLGWVNMGIYDNALDEEALNILAAPDEIERIKNAFDSLLSILTKQDN